VGEEGGGVPEEEGAGGEAVPEEEEDQVVTAGKAAKAAGNLDQLLHSKLKSSFTAFLKEGSRCESMGPDCTDGLCSCKRKAARHLCYTLELHWPECDQSIAGLCEADAVKAAKAVCASVEKLPGVNIDNVPVFEVETDPSDVTGTTFWQAPDGVHW
jgi:hypothetical protein